jgi:ABC-type antimicrobial peptide transport system permease subunit
MKFSEIIAMAMQSLGANKLRSGLTMMGITIGVFSVISVMTAIGALQSSIESGISFLGSNIFQFAKYPVSGGQGGRNAEKYENRRNVTYAQGLRYAALMEGIARRFARRLSMAKDRRFATAKKTPSLTRWVEPELLDRKQLHPRLRTKHLAGRRGARA